jgi:hypothetical protein
MVSAALRGGEQLCQPNEAINTLCELSTAALMPAKCAQPHQVFSRAQLAARSAASTAIFLRVGGAVHQRVHLSAACPEAAAATLQADVV